MAQAAVSAPPRTTTRRRRSRLIPILFILPAILLLLAITIFPLIYTLRLTVLQLELTISTQEQFVGLQNFVRVFSDLRFWNAMKNTMFLVVAGVGLQLVLGIGLALVLNQTGRARPVLVSLMLIPIMIAPVIAGFQFRMILNDQYGPLNYLLELVTGGIFRGFPWLADPNVALWAIMMTDVWQWTPFMILIVLAGLQSIPVDLLEAAEVDGASGWQQFWGIMLPLLLPVIVIGILVRFMDTFKLFDIVYQLTAGGPGSSTETIAYYTYLQGFKFFSMGYTAAMAFVQLIVITIVAQVFLRYQRQQQQGVSA
jgi:multiple sugar transport system permease protein